jgi:hypothetical protein
MEHENIELVRAFNDALNARDVDGMMRRMTDACVFENTYPAPEGTRYVGQAAVRAFWEKFFRDANEPRIEIKEIFACASRCVMRWRYAWTNASGESGYVHGVDIYKIEKGLIAEKLSYVKG